MTVAPKRCVPGGQARWYPVPRVDRAQRGPRNARDGGFVACAAGRAPLRLMGFRFEGTLPEVVAVMLDWSRRVVRLGPSVDATATAPAQVEAHLERIRALFTRADKPRRR